MRWVAALAAALLAATTGCSSQARSAAAEDVVFSTDPAAASGPLRAWAFDSADDVGEARLAAAAAALPAVDVQLDQTGFDAQKFATQQVSRDVPDVVQMDRASVLTYAAQGLLVPLDRCYAARGVDPRERYYPWVVDDVSYRDRVWAVPQFFQPPAIILDQRVLEASGVTPEEVDTSRPDVLVDAVSRMYREDDGVPTVLGLDPQATGFAELWVIGLGGRLVDDDGRPVLDDPANAAALAQLKRITDAQGGYARLKSFTDSFDVFGEDNPFTTDQVGAQLALQWYPNVLSPYLDRLDVTAVPFRGPDGQPLSAAGGGSFVIPVGASNVDAACAWILELTAPQTWEAAAAARAETLQQDASSNTGLFTGSPDADAAIRDRYVRPSGDDGFDRVVATYYDALAGGRSTGTSPAGADLADELDRAISAVLLGSKTPEGALADAQAVVGSSYDKVTAGG